MVGASGSSKSIVSFHTAVPAVVPRWLRSVERYSAFDASAPPPAPKIEPMNAVVAMTSFTVAGAWFTPCDWLYAVMPSASACISAIISRPFAP